MPVYYADTSMQTQAPGSSRCVSSTRPRLERGGAFKHIRCRNMHVFRAWAIRWRIMRKKRLWSHLHRHFARSALDCGLIAPLVPRYAGASSAEWWRTPLVLWILYTTYVYPTWFAPGRVTIVFWLHWSFEKLRRDSILRLATSTASARHRIVIDVFVLEDGRPVIGQSPGTPDN